MKTIGDRLTLKDVLPNKEYKILKSFKSTIQEYRGSQLGGYTGQGGLTAVLSPSDQLHDI